LALQLTAAPSPLLRVVAPSAVWRLNLVAGPGEHSWALIMLVRIWRLVVIMLIALSMGTALCHLLEMPAKITYDGALWLTLLQTLYPPAFGTIGAFFEVAAVITAVVLAFLVRQRRPAFAWTLLGTLCVVAAHAAFWVWVASVNAAMAPLTPETLPADWMRLREQ
jgi:hypothetical protein